MKIRSDFVSNSSSSSFVISVPNDRYHAFKKQIKEKSHFDFKEHNLEVIRNYLTSNHVSLFGGYFISEYKIAEVNDPEDYFFILRKRYDEGKITDKAEKDYIRENLQWKDDSKKIVLCRIPIYCHSKITDIDTVQKILDIENDNEFLKTILDPKSIVDEYECFYCDSSYIINRKTLEIAIRLRKLGKEVFMFGSKKFDVGDEFITKLLKLTDDNTIYRIGITMSGDGVDPDALRKEDNIEHCSDFFEGFTILDTEYM